MVHPPTDITKYLLMVRSKPLVLVMFRLTLVKRFLLEVLSHGSMRIPVGLDLVRLWI